MTEPEIPGQPEDVTGQPGYASQPEGITSDQPEDASQLANPFDLEALRERPFDDVQVEKVLSIPVRKPTRHEYFRVHPDPDYVVNAPVIEHQNGLNREVYWVEPGLRLVLLAELRRVRLLTCMSRRGFPFMWPLKLPVDGVGRRWADSALEIAEEAKTRWVRMQANTDIGAYDLFRAKGDLGEPDWPGMSFRELIEIAFRGRVINDPDHPVLQELDGRA